MNRTRFIVNLEMNNQLQVDPSLTDTDYSATVKQDSIAQPASTGKKRITFLNCLVTLVGLGVVSAAAAFLIQPYLTPNVDPNLKVPVAIKSTDDNELADLPEHAITRGITQRRIDAAKHPLIPLLKVAQDGIDAIENNVTGYTATIVSQVRTNGELHDERYMFCKLRHEQKTKDGATIPFSVYTRFLKPKSVAGQEAIWISGMNQDKIIAHGSGLLNVKKFFLNPDGPIAMKGNRYPIRALGMKNLIKKMFEKGKNDLNHGECIATVTRGVMIDGHKCTLMEIKHPKYRPHFEFHIARIYIDDERNLPIGYEGFMWPEKEGDPPPLLEKYYYTDIQLNPGLTNRDFSTKNPEYDYPKW